MTLDCRLFIKSPNGEDGGVSRELFGVLGVLFPLFALEARGVVLPKAILILRDKIGDEATAAAEGDLGLFEDENRFSRGGSTRLGEPGCSIASLLLRLKCAVAP